MIMASLTDMQYTVGDRARASNANPIHAAAICRLIGYWADQGLTIRRDLRSVVTSIDDFTVAVHRQRVVGCGAVCAVGGGVMGVGVGEIRSIAVDPGAGKVRAGHAVMDALIEKARVRGLEQVLLLTKTPGFFERYGFEAVGVDALPGAYAEMIASEAGRTLDGKVAMRRMVVGAKVPVSV
jgi:N-acetylglutamate synthase-like GNAT family acetyltransferase